MTYPKLLSDDNGAGSTPPVDPPTESKAEPKWMPWARWVGTIGAIIVMAYLTKSPMPTIPAPPPHLPFSAQTAPCECGK